MTLRERLDAAREERRRAAGLPPRLPEPEMRAANEGGTPWGPTSEEDALVIDLRDVRAGDSGWPELDSGPRRFATTIEITERPDACPRCGDIVRLDMEDVVGGVDQFSCTSCGSLFQAPRR